MEDPLASWKRRENGSGDGFAPSIVKDLDTAVCFPSGRCSRFEERMNEICSQLGYFKCLLHSEMTAYYKAKLNTGGKEESNRKKQKQDASPRSSDNQAKSRGAKALCHTSLLWSNCHASSHSPCSVVSDRRVGRWRSSLKKTAGTSMELVPGARGLLSEQT